MAIIEKFDHKVILPRSHVTREDGNNVYFKVNDKSFSIPYTEVVLVDINIPSAEELSSLILKDLKTRFEVPKNITKIELGLDESWGQGAWSTWELF